MKTAVEVLGYTAAPCCLWPLPTSAVCSNPGRECPYLLPLTKASLLPLGIIKTVVCLSAKLLRQLQKVIESATRLAPGAATQRGCHSKGLPVLGQQQCQRGIETGRDCRAGSFGVLP